MPGPGTVKKVVQRIMVTVFSVLEVLGLPRMPAKGRGREAGKS